MHFFFLGASSQDCGCEGIPEIINNNSNNKKAISSRELLYGEVQFRGEMSRNSTERSEDSERQASCGFYVHKFEFHSGDSTKEVCDNWYEDSSGVNLHLPVADKFHMTK